MSRRYDSKTTTFSPEGAERPGLSLFNPTLGRLFQVEYAMEAISHAGTSIGILGSDGIILAAEKRITSKLLDPHGYSDILCVVSGITSDANILIDQARLTCQRYKYSYRESIPVEQLVQALCNLKQNYTQHGGMRPFGCSFLIAGWDRHFGYQLYQTDPSGNYGGWKATCIGANSSTAQSIFKTDYPEEGFSLDEAKKMLIKVLTKTSETTALSGEKLEIAIIQRDHDAATVKSLHSFAQVDNLIKSIQESMDVSS